ncbi:hypothetical protein [Streptomyces sp. URMC 124]
MKFDFAISAFTAGGAVVGGTDGSVAGQGGTDDIIWQSQPW